MQEILQVLESKPCWKSFIKTQCRKNNMDPSIASSFTLLKIRKFFEAFPSGQNGGQKSKQKASCWLENQLKAYQWILVALSGMREIPIDKFSEPQWHFLSQIFLNKDECVLEYEAVKLISQSHLRKKPWEEEESDLLVRIIEEHLNQNKWNDVARKLFEISGKKYFRSGKQCRERWYNHLDPQKKHGEWEEREDLEIIKFILKNGRRKWSQISKVLDSHRTEHMVKNRYKTIIIRQKKNHPGVRNEMELLRRYLQQIDAPNRAQTEEEQRRILYDLGVCLERDDIIELESLLPLDKNLSGFQAHQVNTPSLIYQNFTPTFLNTPHAMPYFMNSSFDNYEVNQGLFFRNN